MNIPFVDLKSQYNRVKSEINQAILTVLENTHFIEGDYLKKFQENFSKIFEVPHALGVASGTDALALSLRALGISAGDEVITVPNTWISTAFSISYVGARPVFVDIDPLTYQMDPMLIEEKITEKTKAIIPVHLYGYPAPMPAILKIAETYNLKVIEDVAQAFLAKINNHYVGTFGDLAAFSFYPSKNLGCYGDGGAILTSDTALHDKLYLLHNYGQRKRDHHEIVGFNSRLDEIQAAVLSVKLQYAQFWREERRKKAEYYHSILSDLPIILPVEYPDVEAVYHLYVIQIDQRDEALSYLKEHGIMAQRHYAGLIHLQPCYDNLDYKLGDFPVAESLNQYSLSLPLYPELSISQIQYVKKVLQDFCVKYRVKNLKKETSHV